MSARTVLVTLQGNVAGYMASMRAASAATAQFAASSAKATATAAGPMKQLGQEAKLLPMGLSATTGAMGALAIGAAASAKAAIDWETAWTGVTKTVDGSPEQMAALEGELRNLATTLPATHTEIAGVAEAAGQLGIERENVASFTKTMIDLGETTNLQAGQAATELARFMNIMGTSQADVSRLGSSVVELGNNFATTEAEIVDMATRIASAGRQIGLSEGDVLGLATALSSVGIEAEAGGTAISRVMIDMSKSVDTGNEKLATFASVAGVSVDQFVTMFRDDAGAALSAFIEGLGGIQASGQSVQPILEMLGMTDVRVGNAMRSAASASDLFAEALSTGNQAFDENTALAEEAEKRYDTTASKIEVAKNAVKDLAITVGTEGTPTIATFAEVIASLANGLGTLNTELGDVGGIMPAVENHMLDMLGNVVPGMGQLIQQAGDLGDWWAYVTGETGKAEAAADKLAEADDRLIMSTGKLAGETQGAGRELDKTAGALDNVAVSAEDAAKQIEETADAIRGLGGQTLNARDAKRQLEQAVDDATEALKDNGKTLDVNTQKGRDNSAALDNIASSGKEAAAAVYEQTGSMRKANGVMADARQKFIEAATSMGMSRDRARELAREVGLIPRVARTDVGLNGAGQAIADAQRVAAALLGIRDRYVNVVVTEIRRDSARASNASSGLQRKDGGWIGAPRFAPGGWVAGHGTGQSDSVPAWLSRGEFVVNAASASNYAPLLEAINKGMQPAQIGGDTFVINATTESIAREVQAQQRAAALRRRVA